MNEQKRRNKEVKFLEKGSKGQEVEQLQNLLIDVGFKLQSDGIFGKATLNALRNFQKDNKIKADGILGEETWQVLLSKLGTKKKNDNTQIKVDNKNQDNKVNEIAEIKLSYSVEQLLVHFKGKRINAYQIVTRLIETHSDYLTNSNYTAFLTLIVPKNLQRKAIDTWVKLVLNLLDKEQFNDTIRLDGRRLILGLSLIDNKLENFLVENSLLREIKTSPPFESLLIDREEHILKDDPKTVLSDSPESTDYLGRKGFARGLCKFIDIIDSGNSSKSTLPSNISKDQEENEKSFMLHIGGPWGSGKSTIMHFMLQAFRNEDESYLQEVGEEPIGLEGEWTPVWFNAWRQQHITPVFWPLMDQIFNQSVNNLSSKKGKKFKAWILKVKEIYWRFTTGKLFYFLLAIIFILFFGLMFFLVYTNSIKGAGISQYLNIKFLGGLAGIGGAIWSAGEAVRSSLLEGSSDAAKKYIHTSKDPIHGIKKHFSKMLKTINQPIVVFIDDLDRCKTEYVVELFENIQTIFNNNNLYFVVAADRRWIYTCFENNYPEFKDIIREPGKRLGSMFLEKAIQVSVSVPQMNSKSQKRFIDILYRKENKLSKNEKMEIKEKAKVELGNTKNDEERGEILNNIGLDSPLREEYVNQALELSVSKEELFETTNYFLEEFTHLLERNPRAIKRYINAFSIYKLSAMSIDPEIVVLPKLKKQYTLWVILMLRWPQLAEMLECEPAIAQDLVSNTNKQLEKKWLIFKDNQDVKNVISGEGLNGITLDSEAIKRFRLVNPLAFAVSES